ncbi:MAG: DUF2892 domain-containing protein [Candidatus Nanohaloarchaea archaeon]|nr:DUF2892 domain-containing protein [Candidatus Nanohaloarchaea archaeon]
MEQNVGAGERRLRLLVGIAAGLAAATAYTAGRMVVAVMLAVTAAAFTATAITCFCGTKKAVKAVLQRRGRE